MPRSDFAHSRVLILVKTYPHPSESSRELVCSAGVTPNGNWVRLYPVDFRYRPRHQRFKKYQWIEVNLTHKDPSQDNRKESRTPDLNSIRLLDWLPPGTWEKRRQIVDTLPTHTLKELHRLYEEDRTSLGVVVPSEVLDLKIASCRPHWKPKWQRLFSQISLFGETAKTLRKVPYMFQYVFMCDDCSTPYRRAILDWELGALFWSEVRRLGSEQRAAKSVRRKFLEEMCSPGRETRFFVGTHWPYNTWLVLGVYWPPSASS